MKRFFAKVPPKLRPLVYGAIVGVPLGLYLLIHKTTPSASGTQTTTATGIPVGSPPASAGPGSGTVTNTTNNYYNGRLGNQRVKNTGGRGTGSPHVPRTNNAKTWAQYNFLRGIRSQLASAMSNERKWLTGYERRPAKNKARISQIKTRLADQTRTLRTTNREIKSAYNKATKKK